MKLSKAQVRRSVHAIPTLQFENKQLTSFAGAVLLLPLFQGVGLRKRLASAFREGGAPGTADIYEELEKQLDAEVCRLADSDKEELREAREKACRLLGKKLVVNLEGYGLMFVPSGWRSSRAGQEELEGIG